MREKLIEILRGPIYPHELADPAEVVADHLIDNNVVPVVRCRDCMYWCSSWFGPDGKHTHGYCHLEEPDNVCVGQWDSDFCSYGERNEQ